MVALAAPLRQSFLMDAAAFLEHVAAGPLLADGGMGTSLVAQGASVDACFEALNVDHASLVEGVHRGFAEAGSGLLWTNTFGANRFKLGRHGLHHRVAELNHAGVVIARRAALHPAGSVPPLVVGSVGPLGVRLAPYGRVKPEEARDAYAEQIDALRDAGVDLLAIETQTDLSEMEQALAAAREVAPGLAVLVTASFTQDDRTFLGSTPEQVAARLAELGADAVGVNCGQGPAQALRVARAMRSAVTDRPLVVRPNAGGPQQVGGRFLYPATPEYFAATARALLAEGVAVLGGCCGTGPQHTRAMASVLGGGAADGPAIDVLELGTAVVEAAAEAGAPVASGSQLATKLAEGAFVIAVEMEPPRGHDPARLIAAAETLAEAGADVIDVADSPMAKMRMSPWAASRLVQEHAGVETVLHFPTRGRNVVRIQGDLLAAHALGIRNLFVCLGDPLTIGDYPHGADVVDLTATGLIALVTGSLNRGTDQAGASIGEPTSFLVGCAVSPAAPDLERECRLLKKKVDAGAAFALTQPLFSLEPLHALRGTYQRVTGESLTLPLLAGVLPLSSVRHAEFIHNEVPGVSLPAPAIERMRAAGEAGQEEGLRMAVEMAAELRSGGLAAGMYVMPQFGRYDVAAEIVEAARRA